MVCVLCGKKKIPLCKLDNLSLQSLHLGPKPPKNIYFQLFRLQFRWHCCLINSYHIPSLHYIQYSRPNFIYWMQYWKAIFIFILLISLFLLPIRPMRIILSTLSWTVFKLFFALGWETKFHDHTKQGSQHQQENLHCLVWNRFQIPILKVGHCKRLFIGAWKQNTMVMTPRAYFSLSNINSIKN
jgi:hypothetical protein